MENFNVVDRLEETGMAEPTNDDASWLLDDPLAQNVSFLKLIRFVDLAASVDVPSFLTT